ncbi:ATP-grasp fold amidoligase family protein [Collinsella intestinalis]
MVFGEITFTSGSGFDRFHPYAFDEWMGEKLVLQKRNA